MAKKLLNVWNVRSSVMWSLVLQVLLIAVAPLRQTSKRTILIPSLVWCCYLLANWVAAFSIGQITECQQYQSLGPGESDDLYALWASFLLVHLGGPDAITSYAIEDNELWIRHLLELIVQVAAAAYSFFLTLNGGNKLVASTIFVFTAGTIKFSERTIALFGASFENFGSTVLPAANPGPDYTDASAMYGLALSGGGDAPRRNRIDAGGGDTSAWEFSDETKLLHRAYSLFESFKGLIAGLLLSHGDRQSSRSTFYNLNAIDAFRLIEYELNFMYKLLHTKAVMMHCLLGFITRILCLCLLLAAFVLFYFVEKHELGSSYSIYLTYALFVAAILLDLLSLTKLSFSEWTFVSLKLKEDTLKRIPTIFLAGLRKRRWSRWVGQYDFVAYSLDERPKWVFKVAKVLHLEGAFVYLKIACNSYLSSVTEKLQRCVFTELKNKSTSVTSLRDATDACSQRGELALLRDSTSYVMLKWSIGEFQYAESLLIWHLATELICSSEHQPSLVKFESEPPKDRYGQQSICKMLSDYMFYLLVMKPKMLAPVLGNWRAVFQDTCKEANNYLGGFSKSDHWRACKKLISVDTKFRPATVKGNTSRSVLFEACILAHQLLNLGEKRWEVMDLVWVELMSYAAIHCTPAAHAQQPSLGGELLTFTWFLMNHLGLGTQFYEQDQLVGERTMPAMHVTEMKI